MPCVILAANHWLSHQSLEKEGRSRGQTGWYRGIFSRPYEDGIFSLILLFVLQVRIFFDFMEAR